MAGDIKKSIKDSIEAKQSEANKWVQKTREDMEIKSALKKAQHFEELKDFDHALLAYKEFLKLKLAVIKARPDYGPKDYLNLVAYYAKIGDCYKKTRHYKREEQAVDFQSASKYYIKAAEMYFKLKEYKQANNYYELASKTYEEVDLFDKAAEAQIDIADMYLKLEDPLLASVALAKAGAFYEKQGSYEFAIKSYVKSAELASDFGDVNSASNNFLRVGEILRKQGKHDKAVSYYIRSADLVERSEKYSDMAATYVGIAQNYAENKDYENAAYYYLMSSEINQSNDPLKAASALTNTARCYQHLGKFDEAIRQYLRASELNLSGKKYLEASRNYWDIASCYHEKGESKEEADFYRRYAENAKKGEDKNYTEGYIKAAKIYMALADDALKKEKTQEAIKLKEDAASSYVLLENHKKAADIFSDVGFLKKKVNAVDYLETFTLAAEHYIKAGDLYYTAECYLEINDYVKAASAFSEYADKELSENSFYNAGRGYLDAGVCYKYNNQKTLLTDRLNKSIKAYLKQIDRMDKLGVDKVEQVTLGDSYLGLAEAYRMLSDLVHAKTYFELSQAYFEKEKTLNKKAFSSAFLSLVSASLSMQKGDYPFAVELLSSAIEDFEEALRLGGWSPRDLDLLNESMDSARTYLSDVGEKPEIDVKINRSIFSFVDTDTVLRLTLKSKGKKSLKKLSFMSHIPGGIEVVDLPDPIPELRPDESVESYVTLQAKVPGKHRIKPLEVLYQDDSGDKYMKSSNFVSIEFAEKPKATYREYMNAMETYEKYAKSQIKNKNYYFAASGYKSIAECFREFGLKRAADTDKMKRYYQQAIDAYLKFEEELSSAPRDFSTYRQLADIDFNLADCYDVIGDFLESERYFSESAQNYEGALGATRSEKEKAFIGAQLNVVEAFLSKVKARIAVESSDYNSAAELFDRSLRLFDEVLGGSWDTEYFEFLKKAHKETRSLYSDIKNKVSVGPSSGQEESDSEHFGGVELNALIQQKEEIEQKIENAKKKYYNRQLDESMLKTIVEDFQKQLIDVDVKIESLKRDRKK